MEALNQKSLDRVVSQRAFLMGSSFPCQICVFGFLCGVCLTSLFLAALTSFGAASSGSISFSPFSTGISASNSTSSMVTSRNCSGLLKEGERIMYSKESAINHGIDEKVALLYAAWSNSLSESIEKEGQSSQRIRLSKSNVPEAPHLENCKLSAEVSQRLDTRLPNRTFPPWTIWKGMLDDLPLSVTDEQLKYYRDQMISEGAYPPWITGSDVENYPLTRKVQRDLWLHQHPENCRDPSIKFLVADWERLPGFGIGAQLAGMCGLLAIAINEKRVLVTGYYNRADHDGCKGSSRASWSCYFFPETSPECRKRALELMNDKVAWERGVITGKDNYTSRDIWSGRTPSTIYFRAWGNPWSIMQPTTEINGSLIVHHRKMDRRWWRAQAVRYLMRFQSKYTCNLMNIERHTAFGREAAAMVLASSSGDLIENVQENNQDIERFVWSNHKPWVPRPLLSMHVRMGDKACEMKVVGFEDYMRLAEKVRKSFPHLNSVWLSTEMQDVIDRSKSYQHWKFYYTNVTRQTGNMTMATYEASLGREMSTNYPFVNFLMAAEADFFIGALGSTWCFLIDGMRNTGGKVMSGYLSVNKDRFW
ncbi:uncharacterized protein LOC105166568 isoform X1 [Sesamum indicum]|uniref:Uncharacterized protein LOC105166568 isoform X1 n=1 Tax=Sesamum indicum TaxID=4182 RepID=A0A8M8UW63_SESIN|nr:uncharacterized protein LOC105166568 isoform X1 [Sesamum indicum]XP_020551154.1 uncharacterized protein LOC105166568 isoform X1 [Sesamum indicum]